MEKLAIRTTNTVLAEQVYNHLKEHGKATIDFLALDRGNFQCNNGTWGRFNNGWIKIGNYKEITDQEYIDTYINNKQVEKEETLQQKKERLEKQKEELEQELEEVNKELEIKVGDIVKRIKDEFFGMKVGDFGTVKRISYGTSSKFNYDLSEYEGVHSGNSLIKASSEEAEVFKESKEVKEFKLDSEYKLIITKEGFTDQDGYLYTPEEMKRLIEPEDIGNKEANNKKRYVNILSAVYQIGCQEITLAEIRTGLTLYEKMFGKK